MTVQLRQYKHDDRMRMARELSDKVVEKYGDRVLAVCICGSTAKKLDRPYSDLEIFAIVHDGVDIPIKYYLYHGLVIEVDYLQESEFLKNARKVRIFWPEQADQYHNRIVLFERDRWLDKLDNTAKEASQSDFTESIRALTTDLVESLETLKNAQLEKDTAGVKTACFYIARNSAMLTLLINRMYVITTSWFWKQARECKIQPPDFWGLVETSAGFVPCTLEDTARAAEKLVNEAVSLVASRGISVESEELIV